MPLASYAMDVARSRGRRHPEPPHPYRNDYQRDRDRILHARAFRRLEAKTQVFTRRYSDHFRNRLTHTLEVSQIARTVGQVLGLNADLIEALALVHDIGHPPFGHAGERKLDELMQLRGDRFDHNLHALRIVESFEQRYAAFPGLNLTFEVREGIIKHSRDYPELAGAAFAELADYALGERPPLEAQLIDRADEIAYNAADLDDGYEAKLLPLELTAAEMPLVQELKDEVERHCPRAQPKLQFNEIVRRLIDALTTDLIDETGQAVTQAGITTVEAVRRHPQRLVQFSPTVAEKNRQLKQFLSRHLYRHPQITEERERAVTVLEELFELYVDHPEGMPRHFAEQAQREPVHRVVCDYIAGMTDSYVFRVYQEVCRTAPHRGK